MAQQLIPVPPARPQGGGKRRADDRAVLATIVYLVQVGCSWRKLPASLFGVSRATAHRRFTGWTRSGLWERLHEQFLHHLNVVSEIDWSRAVADSIAVVSAANVHDSRLMLPLRDSLAPVRGTRGRPRTRPEKFHADKAYETRPTTSAGYARRSPAAASRSASPTRASSLPSGWVATAGSLRPAWPG